MKIGITKQEVPAFRERFLTYFGGMICGAGIGMFLAVAFIPGDNRKIFHFHYFVTAWILVLVGSTVANSFRRKKPKEDLVDDKPVV